MRIACWIWCFRLVLAGQDNRGYQALTETTIVTTAPPQPIRNRIPRTIAIAPIPDLSNCPVEHYDNALFPMSMESYVFALFPGMSNKRFLSVLGKLELPVWPCTEWRKDYMVAYLLGAVPFPTALPLISPTLLFLFTMYLDHQLSCKQFKTWFRAFLLQDDKAYKKVEITGHFVKDSPLEAMLKLFVQHRHLSDRKLTRRMIEFVAAYPHRFLQREIAATIYFPTPSLFPKYWSAAVAMHFKLQIADLSSRQFEGQIDEAVEASWEPDSPR